MTTVTRIYLITQRADSEAAPVQCRLVRAPHPANALRHVAASEFSVAVASQDDLIVCLSNGVKVETAGETYTQEELDAAAEDAKAIRAGLRIE